MPEPKFRWLQASVYGLLMRVILRNEIPYICIFRDFFAGMKKVIFPKLFSGVPPSCRLSYLF
jgi:hypothetical protein